ncbi:MAG: hypothetical protein WC849_00355 [Candidatus Paceibacterota bacterium]
MILKGIKKLQQKSPQTRKKTSFFISLVVTVLIFLVWLSVFNLGSGKKIVAEESKKNNSEQNLATPFSKIKGDLDKIFESVPEKINELKN